MGFFGSDAWTAITAKAWRFPAAAAGAPDIGPMMRPCNSFPPVRPVFHRRAFTIPRTPCLDHASVLALAVPADYLVPEKPAALPAAPSLKPRRQ
jgi:hypothetical protein